MLVADADRFHEIVMFHHLRSGIAVVGSCDPRSPSFRIRWRPQPKIAEQLLRMCADAFAKTHTNQFRETWRIIMQARMPLQDSRVSAGLALVGPVPMFNAIKAIRQCSSLWPYREAASSAERTGWSCPRLIIAPGDMLNSMLKFKEPNIYGSSKLRNDKTKRARTTTRVVQNRPAFTRSSTGLPHGDHNSLLNLD